MGNTPFLPEASDVRSCAIKAIYCPLIDTTTRSSHEEKLQTKTSPDVNQLA